MANETTPRFFTQVPLALNGLGLNSTDKLVFGCIYTMLNVTGKCFMSNDRIANNVEAKPNTVAKSLKKLENAKLIVRTPIRDEKSKFIKRRYITLGPTLFDNNPKLVGQESNNQLDYNPIPIGQKSKENKSLNISENIRSLEDEHTPKSKDTQLETDEQEVIKYLNNTIKSDDFKKSKDLRARLKDGYTVTQLKQVIYYCAVTDDWLNNEKMFKYLRPSTLFRKSKCEDYYAEAKRMLKHRAKSSGASKTPKHITDEELYG